MRILLLTPAPKGSLHGNRITAHRWEGILRSLGHQVVIKESYKSVNCDLLIALHARRSALSIRRFRKRHPNTPIIVALTGTDLYKDIKSSPSAKISLEIADRLVTLQPLGTEELQDHLKHKVRPIIQSAQRTPQQSNIEDGCFDIAVVGHLRPVKDPFRTARASRLLPSRSTIRVLHIGKAMTERMSALAHKETLENSRYVWLGELSYQQTRRVMARCQALILTSLLEGGANVISEALSDSIPIIASRIPGSVGILGDNYPGYFKVRDTKMLSKLLWKIEDDPSFLKELHSWVDLLSESVSLNAETSSWDALLQELVTTKDSGSPE